MNDIYKLLLVFVILSLVVLVCALFMRIDTLKQEVNYKQEAITAQKDAEQFDEMTDEEYIDKQLKALEKALDKAIEQLNQLKKEVPKPDTEEGNNNVYHSKIGWIDIQQCKEG